MIQAQKITVLQNHKLRIDFDNDETKIYDFTEDLKEPIFSKLKNKNFFAKAKIVSGGIIWDNEPDISIEHLYENGKSIA